MNVLLLNDRSQELLNLLLQNPPEIKEAEKLIKSKKYTKEELTGVAINFAEECRFNVSDARLEKEVYTNQMAIIEGFHSTYLYEVLELLLLYGCDANAVFETDLGRYNLMSSVMWVDNGYVAADSMRLLLENGGNPNLVIDGESIYDELSFDIFFGTIEQENRWLYECWVHTWFVLLAFGGESTKGKHGKSEVFSLQELKNHRDYGFCLSKGEDGPVVRIFDKKTFWEVARF